MVFQDALSSLNPVFPVGWQIAEMFRKHRGMNKSDALEQAVRLMERVQIPGRPAAGQGLPAPVLRRHAAADHDRDGHRARPGGADRRRADHRARRHRAGPDHGLLKELQEERKMGLILITHDLGVVADVADRIAVMYAGRIVEQADVFDLYARPGAPVHQGSARLDPAAGPEGPEAGRHRRAAAEPDAHPARAARSTRAAATPRTSAGSTRRPPLREVGHRRLRPATSPSCCWPTARARGDPDRRSTSRRCARSREPTTRRRDATPADELGPRTWS